MRIVLLREIPEESSLLRCWNELVLQMERPEVFYTPQWALAIQSAFRPRKPILFLGYENDELVGVACLSADIGEQNVNFLAGPTADYCDFLSRPQKRAEFVEAVLNELRQLKVGRLVLANLPIDSLTSHALRKSAKKYGFHVYIRPAYLCPHLELGSAAQRQVLKTRIARKRQLCKCLRALEKRGAVTLAYLRNWPQIRAALPGFIDAHVARFRASGRGSFLFEPERQFFLEELARRFDDTGVVTLTRLMVADRPVAWSYGFRFHGNWLLYQTTFDISCADDSPGYCLLGKILIEACEATTLQAVDMGLGSEEYKQWFANSRRQTLHATVTSSAVRHLGEIARHRVANEVKNFPKLEGAIRNARTRLGL